MKTLLLALIVAILILPVFADAQQITPYQPILRNAAAYTNSTNDTSVGYRLAGAQLISGLVAVDDTCAVDLYYQYNPLTATKTSTGWANIYVDSVKAAGATSAAGATQESVLRNNATDRIVGINGWLRLVFVARAAANGVDLLDTFTFRLVYRP